MGVFENFPYTNFHDLNLDWILRTMKDLDKEVREYIQNNKIQFADPIVWNIQSQYPANTLVTDPENNIVYLSRQAVPTGIALTNSTYWQAVFTLQALWDAVDNVMESVAPINQHSNNQAEQQMEVNELFWLNHDLYIVTAQILRGQQIGSNNSRRVTIEEMLLQAQSYLTQKINKNTDDIEVLQNTDTSLQNQITTNNNDINARVDNIVAQASTDNTEIVDARKAASKYGNQIFASLGTALRDQINNAISTTQNWNTPTSAGVFDANEVTGPNIIIPLNGGLHIAGLQIKNMPDGAVFNLNNIAALFTFVVNENSLKIQYFFNNIYNLTDGWYRENNGAWSVLPNTNVKSVFPFNITTASTVDANEIAFNYKNAVFLFNVGLHTKTLTNFPDDFRAGNYIGMLIDIQSTDTTIVEQILIPTVNDSVRYHRYGNYTNNTFEPWTKAGERSKENGPRAITIGTGTEYPTLRAGIAYAMTQSSKANPVTVYVNNGTYNLLDEFATELANETVPDCGIAIGNSLHIIFDDNAIVTALYDGSGSEEHNKSLNQFFQPLVSSPSNPTDYILENLHIKASNTRYCVHDDPNNGTFMHKYINCTMEYSSTITDGSYIGCIGGGLGDHSYIDVEGGSYTTTATGQTIARGVSWHNTAGTGQNTARSTIYVHNVFFGDGTTAGFDCYGGAQEVTQVYLDGCSLGAEYQFNTAQFENMHVNAWNNVTRS